MNHDAWVKARAAEILRALGRVERDLEGEALVSLACLSTGSEAYRAAVGVDPPETLDNDVTAAYWEAAANGASPPEKSSTERARQIDAINRFEASLRLESRR